MNTNFEDKLNQLRNQINKYSSSSPSYTPCSTTSGNSYLPFSISYHYLAIPAVVFFSLLFLRPECLLYDYTDDEGNITRAMNYKNLFITTIVVTSVLIIGFYVYNHKYKTQIHA